MFILVLLKSVKKDLILVKQIIQIYKVFLWNNLQLTYLT